MWTLVCQAIEQREPDHRAGAGHSAKTCAPERGVAGDCRATGRLGNDVVAGRMLMVLSQD